MNAYTARKRRRRALCLAIALCTFAPPASAQQQDPTQGILSIQYAYMSRDCTVTASSNGGGLIVPHGVVIRPTGDNLMVYFYPFSGYRLQHVTVDGETVYSGTSSGAAPTQYLFERLLTDHTIHAEFARLTQPSPSPSQGAPSPSASPPTPAPTGNPGGGSVGGGSGGGGSTGGGSGGSTGGKQPSRVTPTPELVVLDSPDSPTSATLPPRQPSAYEASVDGLGPRTMGDTMQ